MKNYFKLLALFFFIVQMNFAQLNSVKNEFMAINNFYLGLEKVSMSLSFKVYTENAKVPADMSTGYYRLNSGKLGMKYFGMEMIMANSKTLIIHDETKSIYLDTLKVDATAPPKALPNNFLDTLFLMYKDVTTTQESAQIKKYVFTYEGGQYFKTEIYVDQNTRFITKIVSYPVQKYEVSEGVFQNVRSEIEFSRINTNPTFVSEFDFSRYVRKVNGIYQLTPQYSNYSLINML